MPDWKELASDDQGEWGPPGSGMTKREATVYRHPTKQRYRLTVHISAGSNQGGGYYEIHWEQNRKYSADTLDELVRVAIEGEREANASNTDISAAIRNAIAGAEDAEDDAAQVVEVAR